MYDKREERIQKIKDLFHNTVPFFIDYSVGVEMSLLMALLFSIPFTFVRDLNVDIIRFIIGFPGMCYALYRRCFRMYYHKNSCTYTFSLKYSAKHIAFCFVWQAFVIVVLGAHAVYLTGPTYWITETLFPSALRAEVGGHFLYEGYDWLLLFLANFLVYGPVMLYGEYAGSKARKEDFNTEKQE